MTVIWTTVAIVVILAAGAFGYLAWRDRQRLSSSADDSAASRAAEADAERHAAERHGVQGVVQQGNQFHGQP
jgi:hypothetical protein